MATTGAKYPTAAVTVSEAPWSDNDWTTQGNIYADDGATANVTAATFDSPDQTYVLKAYNFDFSAIPAGSTIDGVICVVNCWYANGSVSIDLMQLLDTSRAKVGTNQCAAPVALGTGTGGTVTKGSSSDKWGNLFTAAWVKNSNFGVALGFLATGNNADVFVDYVTLEVFYTPPLIVDLSGVPASAGATSVDPLVTLGPIATTPEFAAAVASGMDPAAVLGSLLLAPGFAAALAEASDPGVPITIARQTAGLGQVLVAVSTAEAVAQGADPVVVQGAVLLTPEIAQAPAEAVNPTVVQGDLVVVVSP